MGTWGARNKNRQARITNMAKEIVRNEQKHFGGMYYMQVKQKVFQIVSDPLFKEFIKLLKHKTLYCRCINQEHLQNIFHSNGTMSLIVACTVHVLLFVLFVYLL